MNDLQARQSNRTRLQFPSLRKPPFPNEGSTAGSTVAAGVTASSVVPDAAEVVEFDRRVFCSAGRTAEIASVMADVVGDDASKLACEVGRRIRKLLVVIGEDMLEGYRWFLTINSTGRL